MQFTPLRFMCTETLIRPYAMLPLHSEGRTERHRQARRSQPALRHPQVVVRVGGLGLVGLRHGVGDHKGDAAREVHVRGADGVEVHLFGQPALPHDADGLVHAAGVRAHVALAGARKVRDLRGQSATGLGFSGAQASSARN